MKPARHACCECGRKMERCRPVVKLRSGQVLWCCRRCWKAFDYDLYIQTKPPGA